ncbi:type II toxin-antitoxin system RelB/DinJ family antitoxin [Thiomicrospira sp. WB1]|uniref:type II toxin-antitoxin system RelB/DinJ family antitoxin n=1 Tax=Thiomicrospira sp. WB1 TaxID=1685380 RepID=UPI002101BCE0|nr:type II toxin-antitoxin system RelB/DinJ family antitoxin [Thiomicrospira sp. WB1]
MKRLKTRRLETLASMGLTVSEAVCVFLTQVVAQKKIPFEVKSPNQETLDAMAEADDILQAKEARFSNSKEVLDALEQG